MNAVRVEDTGVSAPVMLAAADRLLAAFAHRKVHVDDEATGAAARPAFAGAGWDHERHAMLCRVGPPLPVAHEVREVPLEATRALRLEWYGEYGSAAFMAAQEPIWARRGMRAFMVGSGGFVTLARGAGAVEIDSLYVTPEARGDGVGASLVAAALDAGGEAVCWIVTDDEGQARPLYERLGFETRWRYHDFVKPPAG